MPESDNTESIKREMAKPRMTKSVRMAERNLDTSRVTEPPSITVPGTVSKIILPLPRQPEKAQIAIAGSGNQNRHLRIENTLTDEHGDEVRLKKGAHVDVTVTSKRGHS